MSPALIATTNSEPRSAFGAGDGILAKRQTAPIAKASTNPKINLI